MSLVFTESRRKPLRTIHFDNKDAHFPSCNGSESSLRSSWGLWKFGPSRLRRHHSIGSFVPYFFTELKAGELKPGNSDADGSFNSTSAGQPRDDSAQVTVWPDTDDETGDMMSMSPMHNANNSGAFPHSAQTPSFELRLPSESFTTCGSYGQCDGDDSPTQGGLTWMLRNLPYGITQQDLMSMLDHHGFQQLYDFLYMPQSFEARRGKGYAFVNFVSSSVAARFVHDWQGGWMFCSPAEDGSIAKVQEHPLVIKLALVQGLEANARKWIRMSRVRDPLLRPFIRSQVRNRSTACSPKAFPDQPHKGEIVPDGVTTLMIRNLPTSMMQQTLLSELDSAGFQYDFVHMPRSFNTLEGKGYAFVNFLKSDMAASFMSSWQGKTCYAHSANGQPLNISVASVQGLHANVQKWSDVRLNRIRNPALRPFVRGAPPSTEDAPSTPSSTSSPENANCWSPAMRTYPRLTQEALSSPICSAQAAPGCQQTAPTRSSLGFATTCWSPPMSRPPDQAATALPQSPPPPVVPGMIPDCGEAALHAVSRQVPTIAALTDVSLSRLPLEHSSNAVPINHHAGNGYSIVMTGPQHGGSISMQQASLGASPYANGYVSLAPQTVDNDFGDGPVFSMMHTSGLDCHHGGNESGMEQHGFGQIVDCASPRLMAQDHPQFGHAMHWPR